MAMSKNDQNRPRWHRCLPPRFKPWCKDDPKLNPLAVLYVVKDEDGDDADDAGRLAKMLKSQVADLKSEVADLKSEIKEVTKRADARAVKADARAVKADANMNAILALLEGGGGERGRG